MIDNLDLLNNYKTFVGLENNWDTIPRLVIKKLFEWGLTPDTCLLDIGCGSLRTGRFLIPFLNTGNYHGLEPEQTMVKEGIVNELIPEIVSFKKPSFYFNKDFVLPEIKFDMAIAIQVFIHCGPDQLDQCLKMLKDKLCGPLLFTINIADNDKLEQKQGKFYSYRGASHSGSYYKINTLQKIFSKNDFAIKHIDTFFWIAWHNNTSEHGFDKPIL
jgi:cyclopropane fatty-acyl-phospholipid synthase-like methyltransferase